MLVVHRSQERLYGHTADLEEARLLGPRLPIGDGRPPPHDLLEGEVPPHVVAQALHEERGLHLAHVREEPLHCGRARRRGGGLAGRVGVRARKRSGEVLLQEDGEEHLHGSPPEEGQPPVVPRGARAQSVGEGLVRHGLEEDVVREGERGEALAEPGLHGGRRLLGVHGRVPGGVVP